MTDTADKKLAVVKTIYESNARDAAKTLRVIADEIDGGKFGDQIEFALALKAAGHELAVFGAGPEQDGATTHILFHAAAIKMVQILL